MAELLVRWQSKTGLSDTRRGDIIVVMEDGHVWGGKEGFPNHLKVSLPGIPKSDISDLTVVEDAFNGDGIAHIRRQWTMADINIPSPVLNLLNAAFVVDEKFVVPNPSDILQWIRRRSNNQRRSDV